MSKIKDLIWFAFLTAYVFLSLGVHGWMLTWQGTAVSMACASMIVALTPTAPTRKPWRWIRYGCVIGGGVAAQHFQVDGLQTVGLLLALLPVPFRQEQRREGQGNADRAAVNVVVATGLLQFALSASAGFLLSERLAAFFSGMASMLPGADWNLGPTYNGAGAFFGLIVLGFALGFSNRWRWVTVFGLASGVVLLSTVLVGLSAGSLGAFGSDASAPITGLIATQLPWIPLGVAWVVFSIIRWTRASRPPEGTHSAVAFTGALSIAILVASWPTHRDRLDGNVLLYEKGYMSWGRPTNDLYGPYSAGMLGTLPDFLDALGCESEITRDLSDRRLARSETLVIVNLDHELDEDRLRGIEAFVREGGTLIVAGDHTFLHGEDSEEGPRILFNDLLRFTNIRFQNDSADFIIPGWYHSTVHVGLGCSHRVDERNSVGSVIGGGLRVRWPARPMNVGRFGYSDIGVVERGEGRRGWLGDLQYGEGEQLGDIVLAAREDVGDGQVIVIADTTGLTNLGRVMRWEWWGRLFTVGWGMPMSLFLSCLGILTLLVGARFLPITEARFEPIAWVAALLLGVAGLVSTTPTPSQMFGQSAAPIALVDSAVCPEGRVVSWETDGLLSMPVNLHRSGFLPFFGDSERDDLLEVAKVVVLTNPQARPRGDWAENLLEWVDEGGRLLVGTSQPDAHSLAPLLDSIELSLLPKVIGPTTVRWQREGDVTLHLSLIEPWVLQPLGTSWRPLVSFEGNPLASWRRYGKGTICVIGDSRFFRNAALEGTWGKRLENIALMHHMLTL